MDRTSTQDLYTGQCSGLGLHGFIAESPVVPSDKKTKMKHKTKCYIEVTVEAIRGDS